MLIFIDSADPKDWITEAGYPTIQGVTTNPSLVRAAERSVSLKSYLELIDAAERCEIKELMLQLPEKDISTTEHWLDVISGHSKGLKVELTFKIPCDFEWTAVIDTVTQRGHPFLLTGLSNPIQLLWAKRMGADWVAPYLARLQDQGRPALPLAEACCALASGPKLLAASIREEQTLSALIALQAPAVTLRPAFLRSYLKDPMTQSAIEQFQEDVAASLLRTGCALR
jgi:transaldolase